ncbi:MAG TPA: alanyl-tRNA editing protein [Gemmatimonadales bacterium]|jgi:alanyl-tRNA synthetase|nr:alanyl-tRNA editing protein [Gemmatimonadales bacterium]
MNHRRYYTDSYTRQFTTQVAATTSLNGSCAAILEETFFYPTSGGQPHDTGRLGSAGVVNVVLRETDGAVLHLLDAPLPPGRAVEGRIDWPRRFDHMQQHTGQHILSQAFERMAQAPTIGFHLGAERVSIDLGVPALSDSQLADVEALANEVVSANAAVRAWFPDPAELRALALRKQPDVSGALRVVAIGDFDFSACGGTHVATTAEVGLIAVLRTERLKRGVRVEFLCGGRARSDYTRKHAILRDLSGALTCAPAELGASLLRLQESLQETRRELAVHQERALDAEAVRLLELATSHGALRVVRAGWTERPVDELKALALRLTSGPDCVALLGSAGSRTQLLFARSENLPLDLKPAFQLTLESLGGGRGGGARIWQGGAGPSDLETLERGLVAAELLVVGGGE